MIDIYMSEQTIVGFNSNDFFYVSAQENNMMPTDASCVTILSEADENKYTQDNGETVEFDFATQCTDLANEGITQGSDTIRNGMPCFRRELCKNKQYADNIYKKQGNHSGSEEKYNDSLDMFHFTLLNTVNLTLGIGLIIYLIYRNRKIAP